MLKIKGKKVPMEKFLREYIKHEDLYNKICKTDKYKRLLAYQTLARNLNTSPWHARTLERRYKKAFNTKMQSLVRQGITDFEDLPKEPAWLRDVEAKLNVLPTFVQEHTARGQRARTSPDEVVSALCIQAGTTGLLCARETYKMVASALKLRVRVNDLHAAWIAAQRLSMRYLALTSRAGDNPNTALTLSHAQVADVVLLNTDVETHRLVTDESDRSYPEAAALSFLWQLVCAHRLEERAPPRSRVRAQRWTRAYRGYIESNRLASLVVLQRRWYELKLRTHTRMRARLGPHYRTTTQNNAMPAPPTALDIDIVHRYPYVVTHSLPSWLSLVRNGTIVTKLLSDDESDEEEDKNSNKAPDNMSLSPTNELIEEQQDTPQNQVNTDLMDQDDVMIIESHSSNVPCCTRSLVNMETNDVRDVTSDGRDVTSDPKPAIEEVLKNIDPSTVKTEVIIESDPENEFYDKDNKNQNDDSKDDIQAELAKENESHDVDNKDHIVVKQEPGVSMASRIIFVSDEEDISSGKTSAGVSPNVSPETSNDGFDRDVNGGLSIDVDDEMNTEVNGEMNTEVNGERSSVFNGEMTIDLNDDDDIVGQDSDEETSENAFDAKLLMQTKIKLTRIHDMPQWKAHAKQYRFININKLMTSSINDVTVKAEMEDDDGSDIKLRYESDTDNEYLPDNIMDSDFEEDIPSKMARLDESSAEGSLPIAKLPIDPSNPVKQKLMEAQEKAKKRKKPTKNVDVDDGTPDCEVIVPMADLQILLQYLSVTTTGPSMPNPNTSYCCLARKHEEMNTARQWSGLPALPAHKHDDGPCNCCCIDLCHDRALFDAKEELQSLLKDIKALMENSDKLKEKRKSKYKPGPRSRKKPEKDAQNDKEHSGKDATEGAKVPSVPSTEDKNKDNENATANIEAKTDSGKETDVSKDGEEKTAALDGLDEWIRQKNVNNQFFKLQGVNSKDKRTGVPASVNNTPKTHPDQVPAPVNVAPKTNRDEDVNKYQVRSQYELVDGVPKIIRNQVHMPVNETPKTNRDEDVNKYQFRSRHELVDEISKIHQNQVPIPVNETPNNCRDEGVNKYQVRSRCELVDGVPKTHRNEVPIYVKDTPITNRDEDLNKYPMKSRYEMIDGVYRLKTVPIEKNPEIPTVKTQSIEAHVPNINNSHQIKAIQTLNKEVIPMKEVIKIPNNVNVERIVRSNINDHSCANKADVPIPVVRKDVVNVATAHSGQVTIRPKMRDSGGGIIKDLGQNTPSQNPILPNTLSGPIGGMNPARSTCMNPIVTNTGSLKPVNIPVCPIYNTESDIQRVTPRARNPSARQRNITPCNLINVPLIQPDYIGVQTNPPIYQIPPQTTVRQMDPTRLHNPVQPMQSNINIIPPKNVVNSYNNGPPAQYFVPAANPQSSYDGHFLQNNSMHKMPPTIRRNSGRQFSPNSIPKQQVLPMTTVIGPPAQIKSNNFATTSTQDSTVLAKLLTNNLIGLGEYLQQLPPQPVPPPIPTPVPPPTVGLIGPLDTTILSPVTQMVTGSPITQTVTRPPVTQTTGPPVTQRTGSPITVDLTREPSPDEKCNKPTSYNKAKSPPSKIIILSSVTLNQKDLASSKPFGSTQYGNQDSSTKIPEEKKCSKRPKGVVEVDKSALNKIITPKTAQVKSRAQYSTTDDTISNSTDSAELKNIGYEEWMRQKNINKQFFKPPGVAPPAINKKDKSKPKSLRKKIFKQKYKEIKKHTRKKICDEETCEDNIELLSDASMESVVSISSGAENEAAGDNNSQPEVLESEEKEISNNDSSQDDSQASLTQDISSQDSTTMHDALQQNKIPSDNATINSEISDAESEKSKIHEDTIEPSKDESTNDSEQILDDRQIDNCKIISYIPFSEAPLQNEIILQDEQENNKIVAQSEINNLQVPSDIAIPVEAVLEQDSDEYTEELYSDIPPESQIVSSEINQAISDAIPAYEEEIPLRVEPELTETVEVQEEEYSEIPVNNVLGVVRELPSTLNQFLIPHNLTPAPSSSDTATPSDTSMTAENPQQSSPLGKTPIYNSQINNESILTQFTNNNYLTFNNNQINQQLTGIITSNPFHIMKSEANCPVDLLKDQLIDKKQPSEPLHIIIPERPASHFEECFITPDSLLQKPSPHLRQSSPSISPIPTLIVGEYPKERSTEAPSPKTVIQDTYHQNPTFVQIPRGQKTNRKFQKESSYFRQDRNFSNMLSPEILQKTHIDVQIVGQYPSNKRTAQISQSDTEIQNELTTCNKRVILKENGNVHCSDAFAEVQSEAFIKVWGDYPCDQNKDKTRPSVIQGDISSTVKQNQESTKHAVSSHRDILKEAMSNLGFNCSEENTLNGDTDPAQTLASVSEPLSDSNALNKLDFLTSNTSADNHADLSDTNNHGDFNHTANHTEFNDANNQNELNTTDNHTDFNNVQASSASELVTPKENVCINNNVHTLSLQETDMDQHKEFGFARPPLRLVQRRVADGIRKSAMFIVPSSSPGKNNIISVPQYREKPISFDNFGEQSPEVLGLDTDLLDPVRLIIPPNKPVTFTLDHPKAILPKSVDIAAKRKRLLSGQYDKISDQTDYPVKHFQEIPVIPNEVVAEVQKAKLKQKSKSQEAAKVITVAHKCKEQKRHSFSSLPPEVVMEELQPVLMKEKNKKESTQPITPKPRVRPRGRPRGRPRLKSVPNLSQPLVSKSQLSPLPIKPVTRDTSPKAQPFKPRQRGKRGRPRTVSWPGENNDSDPDYVPMEKLSFESPKKCAPKMLSPIFNQTIPKMPPIPKINANNATTRKRKKHQAVETSETTDEIKKPKKAKQPLINSIKPVKKNIIGKPKKTKTKKQRASEPKRNKKTDDNDDEFLTWNEKTNNDILHAKDPKPYIEANDETFIGDENTDSEDVLNKHKALKPISYYNDTDDETFIENNNTDNKNELNVKEPEPISCYFKANFKTLTRNEKTSNNNVLKIKDSKPIPGDVETNDETRNEKTVNNNVLKVKDTNSISQNKTDDETLSRNEMTVNNNNVNVKNSNPISCYTKADEETLTENNKSVDEDEINVKNTYQNLTIDKKESQEFQDGKETLCDDNNKTNEDTTEPVGQIPAHNTPVELKLKCSINLPYKDLPIRKRPYLRIMHEITKESTTAPETPNPNTAPATIPMPEQSPLDLSEADEEYTQSLKEIRRLSSQQSLPANNTPKLRVSIPISPLSMESVVKIIRLKSIHIKIPSEEYDKLKQRLIPDNRTLSAQVKPVAIPTRLQRRNSLCIMKNGRELPKDNISDNTVEVTNCLTTEHNQNVDGATKEATKPKIPSPFDKVKIIATNKKVIQAIRLKRQRERQLVLQKWASCSQLENINTKETLTGPIKDQNIGNVGKNLTRFSSVDGTTEWYREIRNLVESPDLTEFDFADFQKTFEEPSKIHEKTASDSGRVSIEEIPLPEAAEPTALEVSLNDIPLPTDLPPVEMVLQSNFQENSSKMYQTEIEEDACVADVPPKPTTPQPPSTPP